MKKLLPALLALLSFVHYCSAQTKVFKEVSEDISSQIKVIRQDGALVGYLVFTQLEKASEDSFNYKITIMDENLNDIGAISFREQKLFLQAVSFEQDVLCLAYLKSNYIGQTFKNRKEYKEASSRAKSAVFFQFLSLNGKIIQTKNIAAAIETKTEMAGIYSGRWVGSGQLKQGVQLRNIPRRGFACFYGDDTRNNLVVFDLAGKPTWLKPVKEEAEGFVMLTSNEDIWLLLKKKEEFVEGGYQLLGFSTQDSSSFPKYILKDKKGNSLKVLAFDNDPGTGKPYITGNIIGPGRNPSTDRGISYISGKDIAGKRLYSGVFTLNLNGHRKDEINELYSYWGDGSQSFISERGQYAQNQAYAHFSSSFKDFQGNTYFAGSAVIRRTRWGIVAWSVVTAPLVIPPIALLGFGTQKTKIREAMLLRQDAKGTLSLENTIPVNNSSYFQAKMPLLMYDTRSFYSVTNADNKSNYLIIDDIKDIVIYQVNQKKVVRKIAHKDGNILTWVYPAKEGHVMVSETNKKEKYTRFSIEAL